MYEIGKRLRDMRIERGPSQMELAEFVDVHPVTIRNYERSRHGAHADMIIRLCVVLDVSADVLLGVNEVRECVKGGVERG